MYIYIYQLDCSFLRFPIENSSKKSTKSTSCFIFLFDISKNNEINEKFLKKRHGRYFPGDLPKNLQTPGKTESRQVCKPIKLLPLKRSF